jgi:hypothetical protein
MQQLEAKLEALVVALVRRTELKPVALATATADARDLQEEMRLVSHMRCCFVRAFGGMVPATGCFGACCCRCYPVRMAVALLTMCPCSACRAVALVCATRSVV